MFAHVHVRVFPPAFEAHLVTCSPVPTLCGGLGERGLPVWSPLLAADSHTVPLHSPCAGMAARQLAGVRFQMNVSVYCSLLIGDTLIPQARVKDSRHTLGSSFVAECVVHISRGAVSAVC